MPIEVEFIDFSVKVKELVEEKALQWLEEAANEFQSAAQDLSRVGESGQLKDSWASPGYQIDKAALKATVGSPSENALWEEFGTGRWAEGPKPGRSDPWYVPVDGYVGKKRPTFNGKVVIVYGKNGMKYYKTNGKKPNRTLQKAFAARKNAVINRAKQIFGELN